MGLNRLSNPKKLKRLEALIGEPVERAYAKYFQDHALLVFGVSGKQYAVTGETVEPCDEPIQLVEGGIGTKQIDPEALVCWDCGAPIVMRADGAEKPCGHTGALVVSRARWEQKR